MNTDPQATATPHTELSTLPEYAILKLTEVARFLRISRSQAHSMARRGELPIFRLGRLIRVRRTELMAWLAQLQ
jgi:excisionase family DNA binding protein